MPAGGEAFFADRRCLLLPHRSAGDRAGADVERRTAAGVEQRRLTVASYPYPTESLTGVEEKYVSPPAAELARIEREQKETAAVFRAPRRRISRCRSARRSQRLPEGGRFGVRRILNGESQQPPRRHRLQSRAGHARLCRGGRHRGARRGHSTSPATRSTSTTATAWSRCSFHLSGAPGQNRRR